jgi:hypothetical protein
VQLLVSCSHLTRLIMSAAQSPVVARFGRFTLFAQPSASRATRIAVELVELHGVRCPRWATSERRTREHCNTLTPCTAARSPYVMVLVYGCRCSSTTWPSFHKQQPLHTTPPWRPSSFVGQLHAGCVVCAACTTATHCYESSLTRPSRALYSQPVFALGCL